MSGGAYPCNIDCGKRRQLEEQIAELEALLIEYKDAECRAVKAEGEALKHIAELGAEVTKLRARISKMIDDAFIRELRTVP